MSCERARLQILHCQAGGPMTHQAGRELDARVTEYALDKTAAS